MSIPGYLKNADSLIAALTGFLIVYLFTRYSGIGVSPDSIMYASTAQNIHDHGSLLTFNGGRLLFFPVFYPFFLSITIFLSGRGPIANGPYIDGALFAAVIFLSGWIVSKFKNPSLFYKWFILAGIVLSQALLEVYTYLWSETLFILMVLLFIIAYRNYMLKHTTQSLIMVALVTAIGCLTRYAGITLIGTGGLLLLLDGALANKKKIVHILLFGVISCSLVAINILVNKLSSGLGTGTREPSITSFHDNLYYCGTVMCDWASLPEKAYPISVALAAMVFIVLIILLLWKVVQRRLSSYENIIIAFAIVYGLFIVISATFSRYERINSRLLSPLFIPLLIGITSWLPDVLSKLKPKTKAIASALPALLMLGYLYVTYTIDYQRYDDQYEYGIPGYTDDDWNKSEIVPYLKHNPDIFKPNVPIYSNANEAVYIFTGKTSLEIPHRFFPEKVRQFYQQKQFYLVWFKTLGNTELIDLHQIQQNTKLVKIADVKEGAIYLVN